MCGIVGAVSTRNIVPILVEGLKRLEYRGYDSCGVAVHQDGVLRRTRSTARVAELAAQIDHDHVQAGTGIAHTRWATHGAPAVHNAHPHFSSASMEAATSADKGRAARIALVHNGIIENHDELRAELRAKGFVFESVEAPGPAEKCGCALCTAGAPWVAQRVCAMPVPAATLSRAISLCSSATREVLRARRSSPS